MDTRRVGLRAGIAVLCALPLVVVLAAPAFAHGRGTDATNYASRIIEAPELAGVDWAIYGGDELLEVTNTSDVELVILGYEGEPYLRVGPDGVHANQRSPATYLNTDQFARVDVPAEADADAEPAWERVSSGHAYAWHDHRIHYMSPAPPAEVAANPDDEQLVTQVGEEGRWEVPFQYGADAHAVVGELWWVPGPSPWLWLALALPLTLPALLGLRTSPEPVQADDGGLLERWPGLVRPAALLLGLIVLANVSHLVDDLFAVPLPLSVTLFAALQTALFLGIGAFGSWRAWQGGDGAFTALGVGAGAVLIGQGLLFWPVLSASQLASLLPDTAARMIVAVSIVQALPVGVVAVLGTRRLLPDVDSAGTPPVVEDGTRPA